MFEQTFKNIDDVLWKEAGCTTELDYTEQTSWLLFLKYLDDLEHEKALEAELVGKSYTFILDEEHRWLSWVKPTKEDGTPDKDKIRIGPDLIDYVNRELFPYLQGFKLRATSPDTIEYKIGEIFSEIKNRFQSGYSLRDALEYVDELRFRSQQEKHELSHLYEAKIRNMGNAGRNGGEYYTPRPLIRAMIRVVKPEIGDRIYDGACGSAGFLCESYDYLRQGKLTTKQLEQLQTSTFTGKEKKSLAYVIAIMNMILHGIDAPNIIHTNTLTENLSDIQDKNRFDVILANPPFGGKERKEIQQNFPIKTGETAFLFLQHFIKMLKVGGRAAVVIKNTFLSNSDNASRALRQELLSSCNLHTILDCPGGTFIGAGVKTVVLFFEKGTSTQKIWYYQLDPGRNMGKTNALNDEDLREFVELQATFTETEKSWLVAIADVEQHSFDLSVKNPNKAEESPLREPQEIMDEIAALDAESAEILAGIGGCCEGKLEKKKIEQCFKVRSGDFLPTSQMAKEGTIDVYGGNGIAGKHDQHNLTGENIVIGRVGAKCGNVKRVEGNIWLTDNAFYISEFLEEFNLRFLEHLLNTKNLRDTANQTAQPVISYKTIKSVILVVPPLPEQKRIVAIVDEAFEGIDRAITNTQKNLTNARELFESYLNAIFTQKGDGWVEKKLEDLCSITSKLVDPRQSEFLDLPHVGAGNMISLTGELIEVKTAREEELKSGKFLFDETMVLYSKIRPYLMKACRPEFKGLCSADVYPLLPNDGQLHRDFLFHLLMSRDFTNYAISGSDRAGMPKVNREHLFRYVIWVPSLSEQIKLAKNIDEIAAETQRLEAIYQQKLAALNELKQVILQKAFTGELTADTTNQVTKTAKEVIAA